MNGESIATAEPDFQAWPGILTQPRRALRIAADRRSWAAPLGFFLLALMTSAALERFTATAVQPTTGSGSPTSDLGSTVLVFAAGLGLFGVAFALLPWGLGHLFGGRATIGEVITVMLWSTVPGTLLNLPLDLAALALHGPAWWSMEPEFTEANSWSALPPSAQLIKLASVAVGFWMAGLQVIGLSEVHRFSKLRATLVVVLPLIVLGAIAALMVALLVVSMAAKG